MEVTSRLELNVALVGDSDIARWPGALWPPSITVFSGHNGATLTEMVAPLQLILEQQPSTEQQHRPMIVVLCAGENDIGAGISLTQTVSAMETLVKMVRHTCLGCIFLGPKLEPWLINDKEARKAYILLSQALGRCCGTDNIHYVDCLTMFCGETAHVPGALWGNKAVPVASFFDKDQLHLSDEGYRVWKNVVEQKIEEILESSHGA